MKPSDESALEALRRVGTVAVTAGALEAVPSGMRAHGQLVVVDDDSSLWRFSQTSGVDDPSGLLVRTPDDGRGRWLRMPGAATLRAPIAATMPDGAVLFAVPRGCWFSPYVIFWTVTEDFTGGVDAALGVSSSRSDLSAKGSLLGGAAGDKADVLRTAASPAMGTPGTRFDDLAKGRWVWLPGDTVRLDRIASAFTAGAGHVNIVGNILLNTGL